MVMNDVVRFGGGLIGEFFEKFFLLGKFFDSSIFLVIYGNFVFVCYVNFLWVFENVIFECFDGYVILIDYVNYLVVIVGYYDVFFRIEFNFYWIC